MSVRALIGGWLLMLTTTLLPAQQRGDLESVTLIRTFTPAELEDLYDASNIPRFLSPIDYPVNAYRVVYHTASATGDSVTLASGLIAVPQGSCDFPLFCYHHGTTYYGTLVSELELEWQVGVVMAANGYLSVLPDYLGYGATPLAHPHPYLHAASEASASVDLLRAVKSWAQIEQIRLNDQLFLAGYSQGGHAVMATHRAIETLHSTEFTVTAVAPGSGPYDLSGTTRAALLAEEPSEAFFLAFTMLSYQYVYGNLWNDPSEAFVAPLDSLLPLAYDRRTAPVALPLPDTARHILQPAYLAAVEQDSLHPAALALRANDLYDWAPQAPVRMYYCEADEIVPFQNALVAEAGFQQNGAAQVDLRSAGQELGHEPCAIPTFLGTKLWLDTFRDTCGAAPTSVAELTEAPLLVFPNPACGHFSLSHIEGDLQEVELTDLRGRRLRRWDQPQARYSLGQLPAGLYLLRVQRADRQWQTKLRVE